MSDDDAIDTLTKHRHRLALALYAEFFWVECVPSISLSILITFGERA